jgi:uncharacterized membrane protein
MTEPKCCLICGQPKRHLVSGNLVRSTIAKLIRADHPEWNDQSFVCLDDLNQFRSQYVAQILELEKGELTSLENDVLQSLADQELISENTNAEIEGSRSFGERLADRIASFGGSWSFLITFGFVMFLWIAFNSMSAFGKPVDPFPFILLNLILSCLASVQAPVIMMSQNRQEAKDRVRAEHDYRVNLKAELEIRQLHSKLDMLLTHQWQRLLEIQQIQTELIQQLASREDPADREPKANTSA